MPGPGWLRSRREESARLATQLDLPTSHQEIWRYSLIDDLDLDAYELASAHPVDDQPDDLTAGLLHGDAAATVVTVDDRVTRLDLSDAASAAGVSIRNLAADDAEEPPVRFESPTGIFGVMNVAFGASPLLVTVPAGAEVAGVVHVVRVSRSARSASFPRLLIDVGAAGTVSIVEHHLSLGTEVLAVPRTEMRVASDAQVRYLALNDLDPTAWQLSAVGATVGQGAQVTLATGGFGGAYARQRTDCRLAGRGASAELLAAYFATGDQTLDFRTFQDHQARDTTSNLLFKGAVDDRSRSVYSGLIKVRPEARNTNAYQTNHNLKLSDEAWAESVPNLEIETKDVRCSHASTVGPIDEDQRFYLEGRGIPPADAERLVLRGFFEDVVGAVGIDGAGEALRSRVADKVQSHRVQEDDL